MSNKCELKYMTWREVDEAFRSDCTVVLPMGSMEVHGPHSPVGDFIAAEEVAVEAAKRTGAYVLPVVPFGVSEYFRGFPGTVSVQNSTLGNWVSDVLDCLLEHGVSKILLLNGHGGNAAVLEQISRRIRREKGLIVPRLDMWQATPVSLKKEIYGEDYAKTGHGGGTVDTVMQYRHPEAMRMDLYDAGEQRRERWEAFPLCGLGKTKVNGAPGFLPINMEDISDQGSLGAPLLGTPEGGKKVFDFLVDCCAEFIEMIQKSDMKLKKG